ncbi:PREDICTED: uncharacterized protein LOC109227612 [Nicotiana attenuata]|uniref:uncharacterized protein LOC109227612 n=1 Tax=Nicotiana attenuata TaxID=49451 RepID=UPI000905515C|nr:PREDICTED: uncharacterized protein LOC109227612 [Nicotiana attenuata]
MVIILVYVDDLLITGNDQKMISKAKEILQHNFKIKDQGELRSFLGIEIARSKQGIFINQRKFALKLISELGLTGSKPASTPMELHVLSQFMHCPKRSHIDAVVEVVKYIKGAPGQGLLKSSNQSTKLIAFCDTDWASCPVSRRSVTGYVMKLGDSLVSWKSMKQCTVSRSSAEAEYRSMAAGVSEILWLTALCRELGAEVDLPIELNSDSKATIQIAANPLFHEQTKDIEIDLHFIRERIQ